MERCTEAWRERVFDLLLCEEKIDAVFMKQRRMRWAVLIKKVYEVDPLCCPEYGAEMKIISFIEKCQPEVVEKILRHCG